MATPKDEQMLIVLCAHADRGRVIEALADSIEVYFDDDTIDISGEWVVLLAIGAEGGAALATWIDRHGLDSVRGIGLVGVTAPWAERRSPLTQTLEETDAGHGAPFPLPLGPLESLRGVAERARVGELCSWCDGLGCKGCKVTGRHFSLRFVVACAPDDGVCVVCGGIGDMPHFSGEQCKACDGEGKALSSRRIAEELIGVPVERTRIGNTHPQVFASGGSSAILYTTRAALAEHGLRAVVERLTR